MISYSAFNLLLYPSQVSYLTLYFMITNRFFFYQVFFSRIQSNKKAKIETCYYWITYSILKIYIFYYLQIMGRGTEFGSRSKWFCDLYKHHWACVLEKQPQCPVSIPLSVLLARHAWKYSLRDQFYVVSNWIRVILISKTY